MRRKVEDLNVDVIWEGAGEGEERDQDAEVDEVPEVRPYADKKKEVWDDEG